MAQKILITPGADFETPPEFQGQMQERSYRRVEGPGEGYIIERVTDHSDGEFYLTLYRADATPFEPWNRAPKLGAPVKPTEAWISVMP